MRRAMLTLGVAPPAALTPIGVADTSLFNANTSGQAQWTEEDVALESGTVTQAVVNVTNSCSVAVFSMDPTTSTIRAISATVSAVGVGEETLTVSVAVVAGDVVGIWRDSAGASGVPRQVNATSGFNWNRANAASKPTAGTVLSPLGALNGRRLVLRATGTIP